MVVNQVLNEIGALPDRMMNLAFLAERKPRQMTRDALLEELAFYQQPQFREDKQFFVLPDSPPLMSTLKRDAIVDGTVSLLRYPSRYQPQNAKVSPRFYCHQANRSGYLWLWQHNKTSADAEPRPLVLCVHGFRMGHPKRAKAMFKIDKLYQKGMDVALFIQPHHWKRASSPVKQYFFNAEDIPLTIENVGQQIHDLHSCYLTLDAMGYPRIGLIGGSLGGLAVGLYATQTTAPAFIFSVVPAVRMDGHLDPARARLPFKVDDLVRFSTFRALDIIDPTFYQPRYPLDRFAVVFHQGDKINDAKWTREWVAQWNLQNVTALPGGHWWVFDGKARGKTWYQWLEKNGFGTDAA